MLNFSTYQRSPSTYLILYFHCLQKSLTKKYRKCRYLWLEVSKIKFYISLGEGGTRVTHLHPIIDGLGYTKWYCTTTILLNSVRVGEDQYKIYTIHVMYRTTYRFNVSSLLLKYWNDIIIVQTDLQSASIIDFWSAVFTAGCTTSPRNCLFCRWKDIIIP